MAVVGIDNNSLQAYFVSSSAINLPGKIRLRNEPLCDDRN